MSYNFQGYYIEEPSTNENNFNYSQNYNQPPFVQDVSVIELS